MLLPLNRASCCDQCRPCCRSARGTSTPPISGCQELSSPIQVVFAHPLRSIFVLTFCIPLLRDGNNNLKWRGGGAGGPVATFTPPKPKAAPKKRFQEDGENQDPALATPPPRQAPSRPPFGAPRWNKNAKEAIKSSAEKRPGNAEKEALLNKHAPPRQLKSTLSARNLFSGKDILGQISEFYDELKRMVGGGGSRPVTDIQEENNSNSMQVFPRRSNAEIQLSDWHFRSLTVSSVQEWEGCGGEGGL